MKFEGNLMLLNFVNRCIPLKTHGLEVISEKLKQVRKFRGFSAPPKLAQGPRGRKLRFYSTDYPQTTCQNIINFGIPSRYPLHLLPAARTVSPVTGWQHL